MHTGLADERDALLAVRATHYQKRACPSFGKSTAFYWCKIIRIAVLNWAWKELRIMLKIARLPSGMHTGLADEQEARLAVEQNNLSSHEIPEDEN